jgi:hypothetical protein
VLRDADVGSMVRSLATGKEGDVPDPARRALWRRKEGRKLMGGLFVLTLLVLALAFVVTVAYVLIKGAKKGADAVDEDPALRRDESPRRGFFG